MRSLAAERFDTIKVQLAEHLVIANIGIISSPAEQSVRECLALTGYLLDAEALASAMERDCEAFVTCDKRHLLGNPNIGPPRTRIGVMSGGKALDWAVDQVSVRSRLRMEHSRRG